MNVTTVTSDVSDDAIYMRTDTTVAFQLFMFGVCVALWTNMDSISRIFKVITALTGARFLTALYITLQEIGMSHVIFWHLLLLSLQITACTWLYLMNLKYAPARMVSLIVYSFMTMMLISLGVSERRDCDFFLIMGMISTGVQAYFVIQNNIHEVNQGTEELPAVAGWFPVLISAGYVYMMWESDACDASGEQFWLAMFVIDVFHTVVFMTFIALRVHMVVDANLFEITSDTLL